VKHIGVAVIVRRTKERAPRAFAMAVSYARLCGGKSSIGQPGPGAIPAIAIVTGHKGRSGEALTEFGTAVRAMTEGASKLAVEQGIAESDHAFRPAASQRLNLLRWRSLISLPACALLTVLALPIAGGTHT
jgi:hypothetical protein